MKYISWNVNGIRAILKKNFKEYLEDESPDIIGLQEVKWRFEQLTKKDQEYLNDSQYHVYWNAAERPGYSGTAVLSKKEALSVQYGIPKEAITPDSLISPDEVLLENHEGRITTLEFENHYYVTVYTPNSKDDLSRLDYRYSTWDKAFLEYLQYLEQTKPVIACGDLNVAHKEIDLARPKQNTKSPGFTLEEREGLTNFIWNGFLDSFRIKFPDTPDRYSWWSYRGWARSRNVGWRIDYFLISSSLEEKLTDAFIRDDILGSDHCPVWVDIQL